MATFSDMRFAHTEGVCDLVYSPSGECVVTCGADGEVRLYKGIDDESPTSHLIGDETLAVACAEDVFYVAPSDTNKVQSYGFPDGSSKDLVAKFTADSTALSISRDGATLAAGSGDMTIKVVETTSFKYVNIEGHTAPILSLALSDARDRLVSASCDGNVCLWKLEPEAASKLATFALLKSTSDAATAPSPAKVAWQNKGSLFSVPTQKAVKLYDGEKGEDRGVLTASDLADDEHMAATTWSPDGRHLASGTTKGRIIVWNVEDKKAVAEKTTSRGYGINSIAWNPQKGSEMAFIDNQGYWGLLENLPVSARAPSKPAATGNASAVHIVDDKDEFNEEELAAALFESDDDDNENSFSIRKIKKETGFLSGGEEENSNLSNADVKGKDKGDFSSKPGSRAPSPLPAVAAPTPPPRAPVIQVQEAFQPGSTPIYLSSRFMVWNAVGMVRSYQGSDEDSSIDVAFHDSSVHHPLHMANHHGHVLADLTSELLALACEAREEDLTPSRIFVNFFAAPESGGREWSVELPAGEDVMTLCAGKGWVAAVTDMRQLRVFTASGMQLKVLSLPGPVVAMAGHGDKLVVAVHNGTPLPGNQSISCCIFHVYKENVRSPPYFHVPLVPKSELSWIGFSDEGVLSIMDSAGFVRIMLPSGQWAPVCDTKSNVKGKSDHHFIVGLSVAEKNIRTVLCKGSRYPMTVPLPTVVVTPMTIPLCQAATEKSNLEEDYIKSKIVGQAIQHASDDAADAVEQEKRAALIKLFALACHADNDSRALDVCKLMDSATFQMAYTYASKNRRLQLVNRMSKLADELRDEEEREAEEQMRAEVESSTADMFESRDNDFVNADEMEEASEESNPLLAAKIRREAGLSGGRARSILKESQSDVRNPFKKSSNQTSGAITQGLCFDSMSAKSTELAKSRGSQFGARNLNSKPPTAPLKPPAKLTLTKQIGLAQKKETTKENSTPLKGFQLWLAENKDSFGNVGSDELNSVGLQRWKELTKEEKEQYKSPRVPKRKRDEPEADDDIIGSSQQPKASRLSV